MEGTRSDALIRMPRPNQLSSRQEPRGSFRRRIQNCHYSITAPEQIDVYALAPRVSLRGGGRGKKRGGHPTGRMHDGLLYTTIPIVLFTPPHRVTGGAKMTSLPRRSPPLRGRGRAGLRALTPMVNIHEWSPVPASVPAHPDPSSISPDAWRRLESATFSVMHKIQPTVSSQHLRARVIDYLQHLFKLHHDGYQVLRLPSLLQLVALRSHTSGLVQLI